MRDVKEPVRFLRERKVKFAITEWETSGGTRHLIHSQKSQLCPICEAAKINGVGSKDNLFWLRDAIVMGMNEDEAAKIVNAADESPGHDPKVRKLLLMLCK